MINNMTTLTQVRRGQGAMVNAGQDEMAITLKEVEGIWDLTPLQQGMLFHALYAPESSVYTIQLDLALEGDLVESALAQAWRLLLERHGPLRTSFVWEGVEKPYQVEHRQADLTVTRCDWRTLNAAEQDERRSAFLEEDRAQLFDLTRPPLMRLALILLGARRFRLVWTFHHIILEGWSAAILLKEFWKLYGDLRSGRSPNLPPVRPYREYLDWLRRQDLTKAEAYWRETLRSFGGATRLPIDRSAVSAPAAVKKVSACSLNLTAEFTNALQAVSRAHRLTLNTIVQGAWSILLSRYSGDADVVFGAVVSGRPAELPAAESIVGLFVNTLPARVRVDGDRRLIPWLQEIQLAQATMRQYEHSSLVQVQAWSGAPGGQPLFHTVLAFENWLNRSGQGTRDLRVVECELVEASDQPLTLFVTLRRGLALTLMYDVERFEHAAVQRMLAHYRVLLESVVAAPGGRISELPILTPAERARLVVEWNRTATHYPRDRSIKDLFEEQAGRTPDAVAVEYEGQWLTYRELDVRANQLAHYLVDEGVGPEVMVGICVERSLEMVVGILGILKAGGAYVPLDPDYPASRLAFMLEDTKAPVLLTQAKLRGRLPAYGGRVLCLDADWPQIARERRDSPGVAVGAGNLAYVMYTSGSTGQPKGTCIEQRSVVRLVKATDYIELGPDEVFLQYSPISFDASTLELWGSLLNGGKLVVCPGGLLSLEELGRVIRERGVSTLWLTAALFNQMVDEQIEALRGVRQLLAGGEALSVSHVRRMLEVIGTGRLINGYGPTENTTFTCCYVMTADTRIEHTVPIGRPISNTRVYILDGRMQPVPVGVYGELYIGGDGLAREYLHRPELTAEKFVPDPFSAEEGARLYRTGDLVRYRGDGCIEFLGRVDHQVKIRGFRVELGEIEATLGRHPRVREAVVVVREEEPGDKRLVAYIVGAPDARPSADELRRHLRASLPEYMVPAAFVVLDKFPITPNGKVDRAALPPPDAKRQLGAGYVQPRTELELKLAAIWRDVLRVDGVSVDDNFFDLGGNSLLLIRVHGKLRPLANKELRVVDLFRFPTIRLLANHLGCDGVADSGNYEGIQERARKRRKAIIMQQPVSPR